MSTPINLTAVITAIPEHTEALKAILLELVKGSTSEAACIQYDLHQAADFPNVFIFHEIWKDAESLTLHNATPHVQKFIADSAPILLEAPKIYITNKIQ
jgi:quinol monooxygenase YgiN